MTRFASTLIAAVLPLAALAAPAAVDARSNGTWFTVELATPTEQSRAIAGGVVFHCEGATCIAPRSGDRPLRVCSELRREVGAIASFTAGGDAMNEQMLARCNS